MLEELLAWFGTPELFNMESTARLVLRLLTDLFFTTLVVRFIYVRHYKWNDYVFTYFSFNVITFSLCFMLQRVPIELGFALGLFAVFGILRYRTEPIKIRDLTYLFVVIGVGILNAVANESVSLIELLLINSLIVGMTAFLESQVTSTRLEQKKISYDNLPLLKSGNEKELVADIAKRTGLKVLRVEIESIDLVRDVARLTVYASHGSGIIEP